MEWYGNKWQRKKRWRKKDKKSRGYDAINVALFTKVKEIKKKKLKAKDNRHAL